MSIATAAKEVLETANFLTKSGELHQAHALIRGFVMGIAATYEPPPRYQVDSEGKIKGIE